jgi:predicted transglutaminase-like protease
MSIDQKLPPRTLANVLEELAKLPGDLIVKSASLRMVTDAGNDIDYRYPGGPVLRA